LRPWPIQQLRGYSSGHGTAYAPDLPGHARVRSADSGTDCGRRARSGHGREQQVLPPPVKQAALRLGLPAYQPERVRRPQAVEYLRALGTEAMVVVGYGQIIPQVIIDMAPRGIINVHASLLPKYRGAGPIQWAIINGETRTGVTTMKIDAGLDTGDMLLKAETEIGPDENAVELGKRLAVMGAELLVRTLEGLERGTIQPQKQDPAGATYAPILKKEDGLISWSVSAAAVHNRVRGLEPWPGAYTRFRGQTLHIWRSRLHEGGQGRPGRFAGLKPPRVWCGAGSLELVEVQLEGRKRMAAADFANGQRLSEHDYLGEPGN
jgi:methionyl-tRNA formyltransferase